MEEKKENPRAFAMSCFVNDDYSYIQKGMNLRDYFAGQALMSMLNAPQKIKDEDFDIAAELSYKFADAMLKARLTPQPKFPADR